MRLSLWFLLVFILLLLMPLTVSADVSGIFPLSGLQSETTLPFVITGSGFNETATGIQFSGNGIDWFAQNFVVISGTEIDGTLDIANAYEVGIPAPIGEYTVLIQGIEEYSSINFTVLEVESTPTPTPTETLAVNCGNISVFPLSIEQTSIQWQWDINSNITGLSIDGYTVHNYDLTTNQFILSDLDENSIHTIRISNISDTGCNTTYTLEKIQTENEKFWSFVNLYIVFIIALICCIIGAFIPPVGLIACIFSVIGLATSAHNSFTMGLLFTIVLIVGIVECITMEW